MVEVQAELNDLAEWGALAKLVGESHQSYFAVPVFTGIARAPGADELKHLGASLASYGSMAMFHMVGFTPEASTLDAALGGNRPTETMTVADFDDGPDALEMAIRLAEDLLSQDAASDDGLGNRLITDA